MFILKSYFPVYFERLQLFKDWHQSVLVQKIQTFWTVMIVSSVRLLASMQRNKTCHPCSLRTKSLISKFGSHQSFYLDFVRSHKV